MKRLVLIVLSLSALAIVTSGCVVRHHPRVVAHVPAPHAVVIHTPAPRAHVRVRPRPRPRRCYERRCRRVCNPWGCFDRCRRVSHRCH
jgi:hypothetical protein